MFLIVVLFLTVPPQLPVIKGYTGEVVKNKELKLTCISPSGNPLATLQWLKVSRRSLIKYLSFGLMGCYVNKMNSLEFLDWNPARVGIIMTDMHFFFLLQEFCFIVFTSETYLN